MSRWRSSGTKCLASVRTGGSAQCWPGVVAMVSQRRFDADYVAVKRRLEAGELGEVRLHVAHVPWFRQDCYFEDSPMGSIRGQRWITRQSGRAEYWSTAMVVRSCEFGDCAVSDSSFIQGCRRNSCGHYGCRSGAAALPPGPMKNGWTSMSDGEVVYYISNPSAGLWSTREMLDQRAGHEKHDG